MARVDLFGHALPALAPESPRRTVITGPLHFGYQCIAVDPPWSFDVWSERGMGRSPDQHYGTMRDDEILALNVGDFASRDCVLLLWIIDTKMPLALDCMARWGFRYIKVGFVWEKVTISGAPKMSTGYWSRNCTEICLLGTCGDPPRKNADVRQLFRSRPREHSRKPEEFYRAVERLCHGPYLEIFSRTRRPNWTVWGREVDKFTEAA